MSTLTPAQHLAVAARGNVLLEAGAGAGKTSTLVARCLAVVLSGPAPIPLDQLLMVTFTEAAATEMRHRIRVELTRRLTAAPNDQHLAEQLALLDQAHIGTLHSFCLRLIREHFEELALDPQVRVLDETEAGLIARETLRDLLDAAYESEEPSAVALRDFIRRYAGGRDEAVADLVRAIHQFAQSLPDPADWLATERGRWTQLDPAAWESLLRGALADARLRWLELISEQPTENHAAGTFRQLLDPLTGETARGTWASVLQSIGDFAGEAHWKRGEKTRFRDPLLPIIEEARFLASLATSDAGGNDPLLEDARQAQPHLLAVLDLADRFAAEFAARKRQQAALDFGDIEQFTLRLLRRKDGSPTDIAHAWRSRLRQVFVDEYQDINEAQDSILAALGGEGVDANRFLVGDVKQSIYGFRLARPAIFLGYAQAWRTGAGDGQVLPLADNFRSHAAILDFINHCFSALMRPEVGGIDYDATAALRFGDPAGRGLLTRDHDPRPRVELIHRQTTARTRSGSGDDDDEEEQTNAEKEAWLVADRLSGMRAQEVTVFDRSSATLRPVRWSDMAILLRATSGKAEVYTRVFARCGIPLVAARRGFFDAIEISDLVSLLMLLDNPLQDIPVLAVLRSPLVGLSPDELVAIRTTASGEPHYWTTAGRFVELHDPEEHGPQIDTAKRLREFLDLFQGWREQARHGSLSQCLENILETTRYLSWLGAQSRGSVATQNVERLLELTRGYDSWRGHGLHRFLEYVRLVQEQGDGPEPAAALATDAVRLMTIHASKGLEFPVVVLADLGKRFRKDAPVAGVTVDETLGLCPRIVTPDGTRDYPSLLTHLAAQSARARLIAEELRLLYVAFTRACDRLVLVGTTPATRPEKSWPAPAGPRLSRVQLLGAGSFFDLLGPLLPGLCGRDDWFTVECGSANLLDWRVVTNHDAPARPPAEPPITPPVEQRQPTDTQPVIRALRFEYPFLEATRRAGKTTVTRLRKQLEAIAEEPTASLFGDIANIQPGSRGAARASRKQGLDAAATGIAYHTFFQRMNLAAAGSPEELAAERDRLVQSGALSAAEGSALDLARVHAFWSGPVGAGFLAARGAIRRELPFTAAFSVVELDAFAERTPATGAPAGDQVIVQGVADLALVREHEIWILDFKSDRITAAQLTDRVAAYRPQVQLYQRALERTCRRPVTRLWLHFLHLGRSVEVNLS